MTTSTLTLADFILQRIAEDEAAARAAADGCESAPSGELSATWEAWVEHGEDIYGHAFVVAAVHGAPIQATRPTAFAAVAPHIARHDPARVLAECEAKREVVQIATDQIRLGREARGWDNWEDMANQTLRALAQPHADHPEFRAEWAL